MLKPTLQIQADMGSDKEAALKLMNALTERAKKLRSVSRVNNVLTFADEQLCQGGWSLHQS